MKKKTGPAGYRPEVARDKSSQQITYLNKSYVRVSQIRMPLVHSSENLIKKALETCRLASCEAWWIEKRSLDARDKSRVFFIYTVLIFLGAEPSSKPRQSQKVSTALPVPVRKQGELPKESGAFAVYEFPRPARTSTRRPLIVGAGPAGLFAALVLAEAGLKPLVLERGEAVEGRMESIRRFHQEGLLNLNSNVQFGEGGAGTFSDGKLTTLVHDTCGRNYKILTEFVKAGAPEEILYSNKPHIGTDLLAGVIKNLRLKIQSLGGEFRFSSRFTRLVQEDSQVRGVELATHEIIEADQVILALGHSARDTFENLYEGGLSIEQKAFSIGLRIMHPQGLINQAQYGQAAAQLGAADYKLAARCPDGRGVYTFCMCPGGWVVNASSEEKAVVCNGMSYHARDAYYANSAVLVNVGPEDFPSDHCLAGMHYQRIWESKAWELGQGALPLQSLKDFSQRQLGHTPGYLKNLEFQPDIQGSWNPGRVDSALPDYVYEGILEGLKVFDRRIPGFASENSFVVGVETRSSSPIRMLRDEQGQANIRGVYPAGEGAGYAGGIMSAAMDGMKAAEALVSGKALGRND